MKTVSMLVLAFALVAGVSAPAAAGEGHGFGMRALEKLDLTDAQRNDLERIRNETAPALKEARKHVRALRRELHGKMSADAPENELRALFSRLEEGRTALHRLEFDRMLSVRALLTPAQRADLMKWMKEHKKKHGKKGHGWKHGPGPAGAAEAAGDESAGEGSPR